MKKILLLSIAICVHAAINAQKVYFIYFQSETNTPFYIRMAGKVLSSTAEGYLILPKLKDSTYGFSLGQSGRQSEAQFSIIINKSDRGFLIKTVDGQTSLFDLQNLSVYKPVSAPTSSIIQTILREDNFTRLLARAADDTTLLTQAVVMQQQKQIAKEEVQKPKEEVVIKDKGIDTVQEKADVAMKETITATVPDSAKAVVAAPSETPKSSGVTSAETIAVVQKDTVQKTEPQLVVAGTTPISTNAVEVKQEGDTSVEEKFEKSVITKRSESSTSDGFGLVFLDSYYGQVDTIQLTIPNPAIAFADTTQKQAESKNFLEISNQSESMAKAGNPKPGCTLAATDDDFFKLRRDMAAKKTEADMLDQAKKYFKKKCFRSEQIKFLSTLFLSDKGKFNFFDASFLYVSDRDKFIALQTEIKDPYYINRFRAMTTN